MGGRESLKRRAQRNLKGPSKTREKNAPRGCNASGPTCLFLKILNDINHSMFFQTNPPIIVETTHKKRLGPTPTGNFRITRNSSFYFKNGIQIMSE